MRFGGKINNGVKGVLGRERVHLIDICNIGFEKFVTLAMFISDAVEIGQISGVGEDVNVTHRCRLVML